MQSTDVEVCEEVVHCLREDTSPVNGIDGSETVFLVECAVGEESFDDVLVGEFLGTVRDQYGK